MSDARYFLSPDGTPVSRRPEEHDHADIGKRLLRERGVQFSDYDSIYRETFALGFSRVAEYPEANLIHAENDNRDFTQAQREFLGDRHQATGYTVRLNKSVFLETRVGREKSHVQLVVEAGTSE